MKVENIKTNYVGNNRAIRRANPNFTAAPKTVARSVDELLDTVMPNAKTLKFINWFDKWRGELGGILITAIGTGFVAPFSIAFNPFVKAKPGATEEEKKDLSNTKKYTAMRQPISAILAAFFQAGAIGPIDRVLDEWSNNPELSGYFPVMRDQGSLQKKEYLERLIKKEMKKSAKTAGLSKKDFKAELDRRVKLRQETQIDNLAQIFGDTSQIRIGKNNTRVVPAEKVAEFINQNIESYIKDIKTLRYESNALARYINRGTLLVKNKELLQNTISDEKVAEFKGKPQELKNYLIKLREQPENAEIKEILTEIIDLPAQLRESRCRRTLTRIKKIEAACGDKFEAGKYMQKLLDRNTMIDRKLAGLEILKIKHPENATLDVIKETMSNLISACQYDAKSAVERDIFENTDVFQSNMQDIGKKIKKDIIRTYKETMEHSYKGFAQIAKVIIGVCITLPITCTALNWVYPRFMDIFFPKLAGKKEDNAQVKNGGDK